MAAAADGMGEEKRGGTAAQPHRAAERIHVAENVIHQRVGRHHQRRPKSHREHAAAFLAPGLQHVHVRSERIRKVRSQEAKGRDGRVGERAK